MALFGNYGEVKQDEEHLLDTQVRIGKLVKYVISSLAGIAVITVAAVTLWLTFRDHSTPCTPKPPGPPNFLSIDNVTSSTLSATWQKPKFLNVSVDGYKVYFEDGQGRSIGTFGTDQNEYTFTDLEPWTKYVVKVAAYTTMDGCGGGPLSSPNQTASRRTDVSAPTAPIHPWIKSLTNTSIEIAWEKPTVPNGPIDGYMVVNLNDTLSPGFNTDHTSFLFQNLTPWAQYTFSIKAFNKFRGEPLFGPTITFQGQAGGMAPSSPTNPAVKQVTATSISLTWDKPVFPNGPLDGYVVNNLNRDPSPDISVTDTNYVFEDLVPWTDYTLSIRAFNNFQGRPLTGPAVKISQQTDASPPSVPTNVAVKDVMTNAVVLGWQKPLFPNGPLNGYILNNLNEFSPVNITITDTTYTFSDLKTFTEYSFTVKAFNVFRGSSLIGPEVKVTVKTSVGPPPYSFGNLLVSGAGVDSASLEIPLQLFSDSSGPIVEYILLVERSNTENISWHQGYDKLDQSGFLTWQQTQGTNQWYRTSPLNWDYATDTSLCKIGNKGTRFCYVGLQKICSGVKYCNGPLQSRSQYWAKIRAYTENGWSETFPVSFTTAARTGAAGICAPSATLIVLLTAAVLKTSGLL